MEFSEFSDAQKSFPDAELLPVSGATCNCYRVKLYGKLHFMKRLKPELSTDPRYVAALQKEFEIGFHLDHPHLVHYVAKGDDYLLTEYVDGLTLGAFVKDNPDYFKSVQNTNRFLTQLMEGVGYLHQHQVVHLDLKPSNILMTRIGQEVKLTDLGFCYTDGYTDTMGRTDKYAAPEQINGSQVNATTDIYAIGKIMDSLPLPSIFNKVKAKCLKTDPSDRFQTTTDVINHLPKEKSFNRWLLLLPIVAIIVGILFYPKSEQVNLEKTQEIAKPDTIIQESPKQELAEEDLKAISSETKKEDLSKDSLMADIRQAVEKNIAIVLDASHDSLMRSKDPNYSAGTYLKGLNQSSANKLSARYPHIPIDLIRKEIYDYTMTRMDEMDER